MIISEVLGVQVGWEKTEPNRESTALVWFASVLMLLGYVHSLKRQTELFWFGSGLIGLLNRIKRIFK